MKKYEFHPYANLFPLVEGEAFTGLVDDIRANSLREDIWLYEDKILDGRNRYRACGLAGYDIPNWQFKQFDAARMGDPLAWVLSRNLHRRHLNESQRAMVAAKVANLKHGGTRQAAAEQPANLPLEGLEPTAQSAPAPITQAGAADTMQVSERSVRDAAKVLNKGTPELVQAVERGDLAVSAAAQAVHLAPEQQQQIASLAAEGKANAVRTVVKKDRREAKEAALAGKQNALPDAKFGVIYADPEWRFEPYSREAGTDRSPDNHYPTSATEEIMARGVPQIAADDCALFLWATAPMLPDALRVMEAWGFKYKSHMIWHKLRSGDRRGPGYWFTGEHELLLVGTRGNIPAPALGTQQRSMIAAPVGAHSEKPDVFADLIQGYFPSLPKIELNARRARRGWTVWGNEAPEGSEPENGELFAGDGGQDGAEPSAPLWIPAAGPEWIERLKAVTDQSGMVHISRSHCVAAEFVLSGEIVEAEYYQAQLRAALAPRPAEPQQAGEPCPEPSPAAELLKELDQPRWESQLIAPTALAAQAAEPSALEIQQASPPAPPVKAADAFEIPAFLRRTGQAGCQ